MADIGGAIKGVVGPALMAAGVLLAPETFGASLGLDAAGAAIMGGEAAAGAAAAGEAAAGAAAAGEAAAAGTGEAAAAGGRFSQFTDAVKTAYDSPTGKTTRAGHMLSGGDNNSDQSTTQPYTLDQANAAANRQGEFLSGATQTGAN